jgi:hypothetical protein
MNGTDNDSNLPGQPIVARLGAGSWIILIVLLALLVVTGIVIHFGWVLGDGADVPASGYVAMAFGVIVSLAVGFGLMALIFYSSRKGYDEPPVLIVPEQDLIADPDSAEKSAAVVARDENGPTAVG